MNELKYELVDVDQLIPYINNARTHSADQVSKLASVIKEFGFINPVITDGENVILAGHGRIMAAKQLGIKQVPCISATYELHQKALDIIEGRKIDPTFYPVIYGAAPVLRWMMDNIFIKTDPAGNIKPDKEKSTEKIDGVVATIMALDRAIRCGLDNVESVYDERGILLI